MQLLDFSAATEHTHTAVRLEMEDSMNIPQELFLSISWIQGSRFWTCKS